MLKQSQPRLSQLASAVAVVLGGITLLPAAHAAAPAAGVSISNIAVASYKDATGAPQTVNSNEVRTTVLQVASFTLAANRTTTVNPNGQVALSHTLTNTGNSGDSFTINLVNLGVSPNDQIDLNNIAVYIDANGDGTPDNTTNLVGQTVTLPAGASTNLIVVGTAPVSATNGQAAQLSLSASSVFTPAVVADNTDTVTIVGGPVINLVKTASVALGADNRVGSGDVITYTIAYSNTGNAPAIDVVITDLLPANVTYVAGSAVRSGQATALTDDGLDGDGYDFDTVGRDLTLTLASVAQNTNGTLTFQVTIDTAAPVGPIVNKALVDYNDGNAVTPPVTDQPSNDSIVTVAPISLGSINDSTNNNFKDGAPIVGIATPVTAGDTVDDVQTVATVAQGGTVTFPVVVHNTGNVAQVYEVTFDKDGAGTPANGLPAGSTVQILRNGAPLTNITGTTAVDVGSIAVGSTAQLSVVITLPAGVSKTTASTTTVTISPVGNEAVTDSTTLVISAITAAKVDLTNGAAGLLYDNNPANDITADGEGPYVPATIVDSLPTKPGVAVEFPVEIFNGGNSPDNFNLTATVPAGFTVVFLDPTTRQVVTNSGNIAPNTTRDLIAVVTPAANTQPSTTDVVLTVTSPVSGLSDSIKNQVVVTEVRALNFTPDRQGQVAPGGTVTYVHTLRNNGNVVEGNALGELPIAVTTTGNIGSVVTVGIDLNGDGQLAADGTETIQGNDLFNVLTAGLSPFTSYSILVKVEAPGSAQPGQQDITTVRINPNGSINGVAAPASVQIIDTTTVTSGQIRLVKTQSADLDCSGASDSGTYGQGVIAAKPGECIVYRIVATNEGNATVSSVVITDATPAFTKISTVATNLPAVPGNITSPAVGATGTVTDNVGLLAPAATAQVDFGVKIDK